MFRAVARVVVLVDDQEAALRFYRDVLGCVTLHDEQSDGFRFLHVGFSGRTTGIWLMPGTPQPGDQPQLVLCADDLDRVREGLTAHGVEVWAERDDPEYGRSLHFLDVAGNVVVAAEIPEE
jgi:predicted enzyme related to lactoylglutathione lyase